MSWSSICSRLELGLQAVNDVSVPHAKTIQVLPSFIVYLNLLLTAGNAERVTWAYNIGAGVRNIVSMETDWGDTGDACLLHSIPVSVDGSQHGDAANRSTSLAFRFACARPASSHSPLRHTLFWCLHLTHSWSIPWTLSVLFSVCQWQMRAQWQTVRDRRKWTLDGFSRKTKKGFWKFKSLPSQQTNNLLSYVPYTVLTAPLTLHSIFFTEDLHKRG